MAYYLDIDSLALVVYSLILMIVVICQREKLLDKTELFDFKELCRCGEDDIEDE